MRILLLSPYHGGSHEAWAEGYRRFSRHDVELLTMPARFWKWRMHGGAITMARNWLSGEQIPPQLILSTDLLDITTFLALTRSHTANLPVALYMHENQLTYPLPADPTIGPMRRQLGERDMHYAFINYVSMLAADRVYFNSRYHLNTFFETAPSFLKHYPEFNELQTIDALREKSTVLPVGIDLQRLGTAPASSSSSTEVPLIIWNQRLEFDKNPGKFMSVLVELASEGLGFRVALCGERFGKPSEQWLMGIEVLGERVVHNGYAKTDLYRKLLWEATVTFSVADHEYFGVSILETVYAHTLPLLPARLSYPEIIPPRFHDACLYRGRAHLLNRLRWALTNPVATTAIAQDLAAAISHYDWRALAPTYDRELEALVR